MRIAILGEGPISHAVRAYQDDAVEVLITSADQADFLILCALDTPIPELQPHQALVMLSSAEVFEPSNHKAWQETDMEFSDSPIAMAYLEKEHQVRQASEAHIILRTTRAIDQYSSIFRGIKEQDLSHYDDSLLFAPVFSDDVTRILFAMLKQIEVQAEATLFGTYHYGGAELFTEFGLANKLLKLIKEKGEIQAQIHREAPMTALATRRLNCQKILYTFGIRQQPVLHLLAKLVEKHFHD